MPHAVELTADDTHLLESTTYRRDQISAELVTGLIERLDGERHTLVTIGAGGGAHMSVGGDRRLGLIVYETKDSKSFNNLLSDERPDGEEKVTIIAGGQPGDFKVRFLVKPDEAALAAVRYAMTGELAEELQWDFDPA